MKIGLTLPHGARGNGAKTTGSEQESSPPTLPSHQTRQRPFQGRWSASSSSSSAWTGSQPRWTSSKCENYHCFFLHGVSLTGNGDSLVSDGVCKQYTAPRTHSHTQFFLARGSSCSVLCVESKTTILARMSCFAPCLIRHLHSALRPLLLCFSLRTGRILVHRNQDSCLVVLPNSLRSHVGEAPTTPVQRASSVAEPRVSGETTPMTVENSTTCL